MTYGYYFFGTVMGLFTLCSLIHSQFLPFFNIKAYEIQRMVFYLVITVLMFIRGIKLYKQYKETGDPKDKEDEVDGSSLVEHALKTHKFFLILAVVYVLIAAVFLMIYLLDAEPGITASQMNDLKFSFVHALTVAVIGFFLRRKVKRKDE